MDLQKIYKSIFPIPKNCSASEKSRKIRSFPSVPEKKRISASGNGLPEGRVSARTGRIQSRSSGLCCRRVGRRKKKCFSSGRKKVSFSGSRKPVSRGRLFSRKKGKIWVRKGASMVIWKNGSVRIGFIKGSFRRERRRYFCSRIRSDIS